MVSPQQEALKQRALATAWTNTLPFRALLNRTEFEEIYVVTEETNGELEIESIDLPEGLLLIENEKGVEVAWVASQQSGATKEFRLGDRILALNGEKVKTLRDFQQDYLAVKSSDPRKRELISVEVIGKGETRSTFLSLDAPPSLSGSLLDMP
ncbi:MAG: PDZ domain-containing protein [Verrucomicrobiia bacterium]